MRTRAALAACLLWAGAGCAAFKGGAADEGEKGLTQAGLQGMVEAFADQASERMAEASARARFLSRSAPVRLRSERMRLHFASSMIAAVLEPEPRNGLLDSIVAVALQRWIVDSPRGVALYGRAGAREFRKALAFLEPEAWRLGGQAFTPAQLAQLREMVEEWKRKNPDVLSARLVRFADIARHRPDSSLAEEGGGLLKPVEDANRQVEAMRGLAERALFLAHRMPTLARWHGVDFVQEVLGSDQVKGVLRQYDPARLGGEADRLVRGWIDFGARKLLQAAAALLAMLLLYKMLLARLVRSRRPPFPMRPGGGADRRRPFPAPAGAAAGLERRRPG